jgi:hypothetical protein
MERGNGRSRHPAMVAVVLTALCFSVAGFSMAACDSTSTSGRNPPARPSLTTAPAPAPDDADVSWADRAAPSPPPPSPPPPPPADGPPCRAAQLKATVGRAGAATGHTSFPVRLRNISPDTCVLAGYPADVVGVMASGAEVQLSPEHGSFEGDPGPTANAEPGQVSAVYLNSSDMCSDLLDGRTAHRYFARFRIALPKGGGSVTVTGNHFDTVCGLAVSRFGVPADEYFGPAASPLNVRITAPPYVRAGSTLSYTITLHNPTDATVALDPTASYDEYLTPVHGERGIVEDRYYLNTEAVQAIPAHGSVVFDMRFAVPADMSPRSTVKFGWQMQGGAGPDAATTIDVTS